MIGPLTDFTSFSGMAVDAKSGTTYISDVLDPSTGLWSFGTIDRSTGQETIIGPQYDPTFGEYDTDIHALVDVAGTVYGFSYTRGIGTMNTSNGEFVPLLPFDSMPEPIENAAIDPSTGTVYGIGEFTADIYTINVSTATATLVGSSGTGFFDLIGLAWTGGTLYSLGYTGATSPPLYNISPTTGAGTLIGPNGPEFEPDAMTAPPTTSGGGPVESSATYSFSLSQGESATIAIESLNGKKVAFSLMDDNGDVLGLSFTRRDQLHGRTEQLRGDRRRDVLHLGHRRPRSQVQPGGHPRRRLHHPASHHPGDRPGHHRDRAVGRQQARRGARRSAEPQRRISRNDHRGYRLQRLELRLLAAGHQRGGGQWLRRGNRQHPVPRVGHVRQRVA